MAAKGKDPANWNWQVLERSEGFLPKEESKEDRSEAIDSDNDALETAFLDADRILNL